jgi:uncharacterized membrane protein YoaK (UPF0700 family)
VEVGAVVEQIHHKLVVVLVVVMVVEVGAVVEQIHHKLVVVLVVVMVVEVGAVVEQIQERHQPMTRLISTGKVSGCPVVKMVFLD